ncbi:hypothetical protein WR25_16121 [Diploscapter pachys]|uniref:Uncharacterized protein n=1 Tax=Diploscapter pachys TaxID=2018661 RepID=A0A2A2LBF1_9BILA|nr:hypothetical protein WR25_16121 [Diploscapter pachys]
MKNLVVAHAVAVAIKEDEDLGNESGLQKIVSDPITGLVYAASDSKLYAIDVKGKKVQWSLKFDVSELQNQPRLISLDILLDTAELCCIFDSGQILTINPDLKEISPATSISCSCSAAAWSPDQNVLILVDEEFVRFFSRDFDPFNEFALKNDSKGADELAAVSAGWGSADTQFQGSVGKAAREKKLVKTCKAFDDDSQKAYIKWKADGEMVLVSYFVKDLNERRIGLFDKDGNLRSRISHTTSLEEAISIRPIGNYIATTARNEDGSREFVFFERNGELRHKFPFEKFNNASKIVDLSWDAGAKCLAVQIRKDEFDQVQIWTVSNYQWNLKWAYQSATKFAFFWHPEKADCLYLFDRNGIFQILFAHRYSTCASDIFVVRTDKICLTDFSKTIIPPPMSNYELELGRPVHNMTYDGRDLAVYDSGIHYQTWTKSSKGVFEKQPKEETNDPEVERLEQNLITHFCWANDHAFYCVSMRKGGGSEACQSVCLVDMNKEMPEHIHKEVEAPIAWIGSVSGKCVFLTIDGEMQNEDGQVLLKLNPNEGYEVKYFKNEENITFVILSSSNSLTMDGKLISEAVTSFILHDDLVCYTTFQNRLHIVDMKNGKNMMEPRNLETGALLVAGAGSQLILQMPRGNLETIHPRILVIRPIRKLLEEKKYEEAMKMLKKHRIDMNLLCDFQPEIFMTDIPILVQNCSDPELLNLFITSMNPTCNEWCEGPAVEDKINKICVEIAKEVEKLEKSQLHRMLTSLLTVLLKQAPIKINEALMVVKREIAGLEEPERTKYCRQWLHYVSFFVPEEALYNAALSTYDLVLAVQVAEVSNRDPKEYLPILNEIQQIQDENYRCYKIDMLREDYGSALGNISKVDEKFEEAISLINEKKLYAKALMEYKESEKFYEKVCSIVAQAYEKSTNYQEAGILFEKSGEVEKAISCFEKSTDLTSLVWLLKRENVEEGKSAEIIKKLSEKLKSQEKWKQVVEGNEVQNQARETNVPPTCLPTLNVYIKAGQWRKLGQQFRPMGQKEVVKSPASSIFHGALTQQANGLIEEVSRRKEEIKRLAARLEILRANKEQRLTNLNEGIEDEGDFENSDAFSDASTVSNASRGTGRSRSSRASTTATMRKRKQIEKKKQSLKEGGQYEDSAILLALKGHCEWINGQFGEVSQLLYCLVRFDGYELAARLQNSFDDLIKTANFWTPHAWPHRIHPRHLPGPIQTLYLNKDDIFEYPEGGGMPQFLVLEPEMIPPVITSDVNWRFHIKLKMAGDSFGRSAFISFAITLGLIGTGLFFKADLASSRGGTLIAGCMGAAEFVFLLTAISNLEMSYGGEDAKSGWIEMIYQILYAFLATSINAQWQYYNTPKSRRIPSIYCNQVDCTQDASCMKCDFPQSCEFNQAKFQKSTLYESHNFQTYTVLLSNGSLRIHLPTTCELHDDHESPQANHLPSPS